MGNYPFAEPSTAPSGPAGGALTGTYPNPSIASPVTENLQFNGTVNFDSYTSTGGIQNFGSCLVSQPGDGYATAEGANCKQGLATLNGVTAVVVGNTSVTAISRIFLTINIPGGTPGSPYVSAVSPGVSFSVKSTGAADTSTVAYEIFEPG